MPYSLPFPLPNSTQNGTVITSVPNKDFLAQVERRFPKKEDVLLLVADANGRSGGPEALETLENAGYVNLVRQLNARKLCIMVICIHI